MAGKSFLDVGCNEGFFCGYSKHQGAARVVGIDMNANFVERASARFPNCKFLHQTWDTLPDEGFDVILLASALHYAEDQAALISKLVNHLLPDGTLVLELGIVSGPANEWVPVKRSIDSRYFPTMAKLKEVLSPYAWKYIGKSVNQKGDPTARHVVHVKMRRPFAYLLMLPPSYGKTYLANGLFPKAGIPKVMGDVLLDEIASGKRPASEKLKALVGRIYNSGEVDRLKIVQEIFANKLADDFIATWAGSVATSDIAFDGFIPAPHQEYVTKRLTALGYFPVRLHWNLIGEPVTPRAAAVEWADAYRTHLEGQFQHSAQESASAKPLPAVGTATKLARDWKASGGLGFVDKVTVEQSEVIIVGWAVDSEGNRPENYIVRVLGKERVCRSHARTLRPDVQSALGIHHAQVGFAIRLWLDEPANGNVVLEGLSIRADEGDKKDSKPFKLSSKIKAAMNG